MSKILKRTPVSVYSKSEVVNGKYNVHLMQEVTSEYLSDGTTNDELLDANPNKEPEEPKVYTTPRYAWINNIEVSRYKNDKEMEKDLAAKIDIINIQSHFPLNVLKQSKIDGIRDLARVDPAAAHEEIELTRNAKLAIDPETGEPLLKRGLPFYLDRQPARKGTADIDLTWNEYQKMQRAERLGKTINEFGEMVDADNVVPQDAVTA